MALAYSNHRRVAPHSDIILAKIFDNVPFWRSISFPHSEAHPLAVAASSSKTRIIHDLTFSSSQYARSVNADTDFAQPPAVKLGHVFEMSFGASCICVGVSGHGHVKC